MSQNAVWLPPDLPVECNSKWLIHSSISWIRPDTHTHTAAGCDVMCRGNMARGKECVCVCMYVCISGKSCRVLPLRINYTCGMWVSDWNEYFTAFNHCHCQSDGASGCVTWVIKDAVSHTHTCKSQRLCLQYETEVLQRLANESELHLECFEAMEPIEKERLLILLHCCLTLVSQRLFIQTRRQWTSSFWIWAKWRVGQRVMSEDHNICIYSLEWQLNVIVFISVSQFWINCWASLNFSSLTTLLAPTQYF